MNRRLLATGIVAIVLALVALAPVLVSAQTPAATANTAAAASAAASAARTPWGDPDVSGVWTSDDMRGIPRERPDEFGTRRFLTDEEFAKRVQENNQTRERELNRVGAFRNDVGTRTFRYTSFVVDPPNGKIPALTPEGEKRRASQTRGSFGEGPFHGPEDFTLYDRCITRGAVGSFGPAIYGNGNYIVQTPGYVAISYEMVHDTRIIPLDGRPHLGPTMRQYLGDSRGHWEGNTLVVETANFTDKTAISGVRHTEALRLVERFTRVDEVTLDYQATIDDPKTYTRPWTMVLTLTRPPGFRVLPYECHEGNRGLPNILSAERAEDRALEEDLKKGIIRARRPVQRAADGAE